MPAPRCPAPSLFATALLLLPFSASALDNDGDGYDPLVWPGRDCNDANAAINPNAVEDVGDGVDNDCDGLDALRRKLMERDFPSGPWTWSGTVTPAADGVKVGNAMLSYGGSITRGYSLPVYNGKVHVVLGVSANVQTLPLAT